LFQQSVQRVNSIASLNIIVGETLVVTGEEHRFIALEQLREMHSVSAKLILEAEGKNTAPALTLAALHALKNGNDPVLVVTPADQTVEDKEAFVSSIQRAVKVANTGSVVILGIKPTCPETGFGYIKKKGLAGFLGEFDVEKFVEKKIEEEFYTFKENFIKRLETQSENK
jgi:mannose-1-phosphate guanylyltransferase/mannose-6-phosphate isomerase